MTINRYEPYTRKRTKSIADILYDHPTSFPKKKKRWDTRIAQAEEPKEQKKGNRVDQTIDDAFKRAEELGLEYEENMRKNAEIKARSGNIGGATHDLLSIFGSWLSRETIKDQRKNKNKRNKSSTNIKTDNHVSSSFLLQISFFLEFSKKLFLLPHPCFQYDEYS